MSEILTIDEVAAWLKLSRTQVYGMTRRRSQARQENPLPFIKVNGNIRFIQAEVQAWIHRLSKERAA